MPWAGVWGLGAAHALHRIERHQRLLGRPAEEAAPAGQDERNAARAAAPGMHPGHEAADVGGLQRQQFLAGVAGHGAQPGHVQRIELAGAVGQALLHAHMLQIGMDGGGEQRQVLCLQILCRKAAFREPVPVRCPGMGFQPLSRAPGSAPRAACARGPRWPGPRCARGIPCPWWPRSAADRASPGPACRRHGPGCRGRHRAG